jgi:hypothetical protein
MKVIKKSILVLALALSFSQGAAALELENGALPGFIYDQVQTYSVKSVSLEGIEKRSGLYFGSVKIEVVAEGNVCTSDPKSYGTFKRRVNDQQDAIDLIVARKASDLDDLCLQYSKPIALTIEHSVYFSVDQKYAIVLNGDKRIDFETENDKLVARF